MCLSQPALGVGGSAPGACFYLLARGGRRLGCQPAGRAFTPAFVQQPLQAALAEKVKPALDNRAGPAQALGDLIKTQLALQPKLDGQESLAPPAGRLAFEPRGRFVCLAVGVQYCPGSCHGTEPRTGRTLVKNVVLYTPLDWYKKLQRSPGANSSDRRGLRLQYRSAPDFTNLISHCDSLAG